MIQTRLYDYNTCSCEICNVQTAETLIASAGVLTRVPWQCSHANPATHWLELYRRNTIYLTYGSCTMYQTLSLSLLVNFYIYGWLDIHVRLYSLPDTYISVICYYMFFYVSGRTIIIMWRNKNEKNNNTLFQSVINIVKNQNIGKTQKKISR